MNLGKLGGEVFTINLVSFLPFTKIKSKWSYDDPEKYTKRITWSYPAGFASKLKLAFEPFIKYRLNKLVSDLHKKTGSHPFIIIDSPWSYPYTVDIDPDYLIYLNYDNFFVNCEDSLIEERLIKHAGTILCSSTSQTSSFKNDYQIRKNDIFYFPHGAHDSFINPLNSVVDEKLVCIVGALSARYDWNLIKKVVKKMPDIKFLFVGDIDKGDHVDKFDFWMNDCKIILSLPNVEWISNLKHSQSFIYYWKSVVNWMPYDSNLKFVKSCSPLKLVDGIASGNSVISSEVPECMNYPDWVSIYQNSDEAEKLIYASIKMVNTPDYLNYKYRQLNFSIKNNWKSRAESICNIIDRKNCNPPKN